MTMILNINVTGLDKIADAIMALAQYQGTGRQIADQNKMQSVNVLPAAPVVSQPTTPNAQGSPVTPPQTAAPVATVTQAAPVAAPTPAPQATVPMAQSAPLQPASVQTTQQEYTLDDLATAAMTLMDSGRMVDLQTLLASFGIEALPALPQSQYGAFATALRGMGARI